MAAQHQVGFWSGLRELYHMLSPHRRRQFYVVVALMVTGALAELATIGAIIPFLSLLAEPHRLEHVPLITAAFDALGATSGRPRLIAAAGGRSGRAAGWSRWRWRRGTEPNNNRSP